MKLRRESYVFQQVISSYFTNWNIVTPGSVLYIDILQLLLMDKSLRLLENIVINNFDYLDT